MKAKDSNRQTEAKVEYIIGGNMVLVASVIVYWPDRRDLDETYEVEIEIVHEKATGLEFEIDDIYISRRSVVRGRSPSFWSLESEIEDVVADQIYKGEIE